MIVGVDIGGTFTDLVVSLDGMLRIHKLMSTPRDPAQAMLQGIAAIRAGEPIAGVAHGSTVATNAILERKGARAALITTRGFRDILAIGRQNRPVLYALQPSLPAPIIPRERCFEVPERLDFAGNVLLALDRDALDRVIDQMVAAEIEAVAVCLLHSYANPIHERAIRDRLLERGFGDEQIALSSQVLPEFREYERASTVSLEAYVRPIMSRYLGHLERQLAVPLRIMKSDGGVMSASVARTSAIQTALSGPAAGVIGAFHVAKLAGFDHVITLDMGGTSTDVSLCPGEPIRHPEREIDGLPLRSRLLDIETIGAGGGSIARLDTGGALRVGPESAGADPGSVIYRRGGTAITVSDANAILGRLDADHFLGGAMRLDIDAARRALAPLANRMGMSLEAAAHGIIQIANVNISGAVRRVSVARGHDPRDFTLVAFGGAGPLHACEVAEGMSIPRVLVPRYPGVLCAFGLLMADIVRDYSRSALTMRPDEWFPTLRTLAAQGRDALRQEGLPEERISVRFHADLRYRGQAYELAVPVEEGQDFIARFHADHEAAYGFALPERAVEVVNLRVTACGAVDKPVLTPSTVEANDASEARIGARLDPLTGAAITLYEREHLRPGARFAGPALVFQLDSTIFVAPGWLAFVDGYLNLVLER